MDGDSGAGLLHRLTSYTRDREWDVPVDDPRVRHDLPTNDLAAIPPQVKHYAAELPRLALPRDLPAVDISATAALEGAPREAARLDAAALGRVLFLGAGVVRTAQRPHGRTLLFRAAGSAGARFPLELYVSARDVAGVPDGVHWYDPVAHALVRVGPPAQGATTLVLTGIPWRTGWRYAERGYRHVYWDAGTALSQVLAAAGSAGLHAALYTEFPDASVAELVGADGVHEWPVALLALDGGQPALEAAGPATAGELPEIELPLATAAQRAGDGSALGAPWPAGEALTVLPDAPSLDRVILRRGSQRLMDRTASLPREVLEWSMAAALRGIDVPHWVVVHGVDGVRPGVYRWPELDTAVRAGSLRDELLDLCPGQYLGADAAFVVIGAAPGNELDDRSYRAAQLAAGIVEGRLHLAAYALGATASGMTFVDADVPAFLGEADSLVTLLFTCVGVGSYTGRAGGGPGHPVEVRTMTPRVTDD